MSVHALRWEKGSTRITCSRPALFDRRSTVAGGWRGISGYKFEEVRGLVPRPGATAHSKSMPSDGNINSVFGEFRYSLCHTTRCLNQTSSLPSPRAYRTLCTNTFSLLVQQRKKTHRPGREGPTSLPLLLSLLAALGCQAVNTWRPNGYPLFYGHRCVG